MRDFVAMSDLSKNWAFSRRWVDPPRPIPKRKRPATHAQGRQPIAQSHRPEKTRCSPRAPRWRRRKRWLPLTGRAHHGPTDRPGESVMGTLTLVAAVRAADAMVRAARLTWPDVVSPSLTAPMLWGCEVGANIAIQPCSAARSLLTIWEREFSRWPASPPPLCADTVPACRPGRDSG